MARQKGFEPLAYCLEGSCSIQLSYWRMFGAGDENRTRIPSLEGWCPDHCATSAFFADGLFCTASQRQLSHNNMGLLICQHLFENFLFLFFVHTKKKLLHEDSSYGKLLRQCDIPVVFILLYLQRYRSGHNGADSKSVWEQSHVGSNPTRCARKNGDG